MYKRTVDNIGRVTLPASMRKNLSIQTGDNLNITQKGHVIILQPTHSWCIMCGKVTDLVEIEDSSLCLSCARKVEAAVKTRKAAP